jgi:AcrR family transcriptional regulator
MTTPTSTTAPLDWRAFPGDPLPPILRGAQTCFVDHGYHGTTIREVAAATGLSVPGLYHHYKSKQSLLVAICQVGMGDLWERSQAALAEAGNDLVRRLDLLVECLVLFHAHRRELAFIASAEIRGLEPEARDAHIAARDRQQRLMDAIVESGVAAGLFTNPFRREASRAVVTMCTGVSQWYRPDGGLSATELAEQYRVVARMAVGAPAG